MMGILRRVLIGSAGALWVLAAVFHKHLVQHPVSSQGPKRLVVGDKVPNFEVADLSGKVVKLSELQKRAESGVRCARYSRSGIAFGSPPRFSQAGRRRLEPGRPLQSPALHPQRGKGTVLRLFEVADSMCLLPMVLRVE